MTNPTRADTTEQFHADLRCGLDSGAISGVCELRFKNKYGTDFKVTVPITYSMCWGMEEIAPAADLATYWREVPLAVAMMKKKQTTKRARKEEEAQRRAVRRARLEEELLAQETAVSRAIDDEDSDADSDSGASEARTEQSHSTSGLSGYTEDLEGPGFNTFGKAPSSGVSYQPSEASESVASRRQPVGLRSHRVVHNSLPEFRHTGEMPPPPVVVHSASSSAASSAASSGSSAWSSSAAPSSTSGSSAAPSSAASSSSASSSASSAAASTAASVARFCSSVAAPVASAVLVAGARSYAGV